MIDEDTSPAAVAYAAESTLLSLGYRWEDGMWKAPEACRNERWKRPPTRVGHDVLPAKLMVMDGRKSAWPRIEEMLRKMLASAWAGYNGVEFGPGKALYRGSPDIDFMAEHPHDLQLLMQINMLAKHNEAPKLAPIHFYSDGMIAVHNMPCAVHQNKSAIYEGWRGVYRPSDDAHAEGWRLIQLKTRFQRWLYSKFFRD